MITLEEARRMADKAIKATCSVPGDVPEILDDATRTTDYGWIFFYNSRRFLQTGDNSARLAGNGPVIVEKNSGKATRLGTARGIENQIKAFEEKRKAAPRL